MGTSDAAMTTSLARIAEQIRDAGANQQPLQIRGGGSKDFFGEVIQGAPLSTLGYSGIVSYEPTELVITAKAGTPLSEIEHELAAKNQMLAFEPPRFNANATIGGVIASGLSGPRRASQGAAKDFVLGASLLNHLGEELHFGGQVMKNVAGYDVSRLLCGSLGILGVITQVSLKVLPTVSGDVTIQTTCSEQQALKWLNHWAGQSLPIACTVWQSINGEQGELSVRLAGAPTAVESAKLTLAKDTLFQPIDQAQALRFWSQIRDQKHDFFQAAALVRLSVPSTSSSIASPGTPGLIEWGGALRWLAFNSAQAAYEFLAASQSQVAQSGGTASVFRVRDGRSRFAPLDPIALKIHQRLKAEFDPQRIFNRGRLHSAL
jgi:glycolate oxidase FAD binding subunit